MSRTLSSDAVRSRFSAAMSALYRQEVPHYGELIDIVAKVNAQAEASDGTATLGRNATRLPAERHGAIRVGSARELALMGRFFAALGMEPVGYYDLSAAGIPVHSTAFRPVSAAALAASPFRIFCSLLRLDAIEDAVLRERAEALLAARRIGTARLDEVLERAEAEGGVNEADAEVLLADGLAMFRWHGRALVDQTSYRALQGAHPLIADIVAFPGPHINHLTPRTCDIDAAQAAMTARGLRAKTRIEGPPRRRCPILLRQTSFTALAEPVHFADGSTGSHTARFGEIEQRGAALTPKGRALYDRCLAEAAEATGHAGALQAAFADFPDDWEALRAHDLAWFREGEGGAQPVTYEDFLPVSAAGIFRSNLAGSRPGKHLTGGGQAEFQAALGRPVRDPFALYAAEAAGSVATGGEQNT